MTFDMQNNPLRQSSASPHAGRDAKALLGRRVMIVEDEVLLAMDLQYSLEEHGITIVGPAHSIADGLALVESEEIDAAILDVDLNGKDVFPVASRLHEKDVPFLFHTGHATREQLKALFPNVMVCHKPVMASEMVERLHAIIVG